MTFVDEDADSILVHVGVKLRSRGQVLLVRLSTTSSSRRQCDGGGGSGLFSDSDSFYQLCQLSALPASILGLSEQTKTGATRGRGRQSRRKPMPQAVLARGVHPLCLACCVRAFVCMCLSVSRGSSWTISKSLLLCLCDEGLAKSWVLLLSKHC